MTDSRIGRSRAGWSPTYAVSTVKVVQADRATCERRSGSCKTIAVTAAFSCGAKSLASGFRAPSCTIEASRCSAASRTCHSPVLDCKYVPTSLVTWEILAMAARSAEESLSSNSTGSAGNGVRARSSGWRRSAVTSGGAPSPARKLIAALKRAARPEAALVSFCVNQGPLPGVL